MEENFLKQTHAQRQEAAQTRREEKKRAEKERIMNEEDPERQRRMEVWNGTLVWSLLGKGGAAEGETTLLLCF